MTDLSLPYNWNPRWYQGNLWKAHGKYKRMLAIWPRRHGKDDVNLHANACAAFERVGNYWYMLPEYNQCRKAIWDAVNPHTGIRRIDEAFPDAIRAKLNDNEMKITFINGSTWQLMGSDNYDALVGSPPVGLTYSEYAISNPISWGYMRPILLENGGWASFNSTPRGKNHLYRMYNMAMESEEWFCELLTVDETELFSKAQLDNELSELIAEHEDVEYATALWKQEYWCSFEAALPGAIWGGATANLEKREQLMLDVKAGYTVASLAEHYGVTKQNIYYLIHRRREDQKKARKKNGKR
jgi:phage terminase large subunit